MKIVIVTGASSGLGREFVRQIESLYKELDEIWLIARREDRLLEVESRMMTKVRIFAADLRHRSAFDKIAAALQEFNPDVRMPVSYTHLDVYKRQPQVWSIRFLARQL